MAFSFPFFKKKPEKHVYFGLYFTESRITGFAFDLDGQKANILSQNGYDVSAGYDKMLEDTDSLISDLESKTKIPLDKTIFFLHSTLLDDQTHDIKEPHKETLKKISKELELEPMGYIDVHESIEGNMKENSVINNILLELSPQQLAIFVYKGGVMTASQTISRTDSVAADLKSALKMLPGKIILPSKVILYGVGDLTKASADIALFKWDEKLFVQHPSIEILNDIPLYQILADTFVAELIEQDAGGVLPAKQQAPAVEGATSMPFGFAAGGAAVPVSTVSSPISPSVEPMESPKKSWLSTIVQHFSARPAKVRGTSFALGLTIAGVIILLSSLFVGYEYFLHKATVEITLPTEELSQEFDLTLPIVESVSADELGIIKHSKVIEYDDQKNTTGKRDVGEKAKGDVILHNFDNAEKTVDRGTELKAGNLLFILDSDAKIASSSGISSDGIKQSGKQKVSATAKDIGPDYNISKGTQLTVGSLSDSLFVAIADAAFTGGTKKQVTTVSKSDMDTLKKTVEAEIKKQAEEEVEKLIEAADDIIPELTMVDVTETDYSGEVGEEAKNISIKASSEINYYTVDKNQLKKALFGLLSKEKKESFSISEDKIIYTVRDAEITTAEDEVELSLEASTQQFKQVDLEKIKNTLSFKPVSKIEDQVRSAFEVEGVSVSSEGKIVPFASAWLPLFKKNISVKTSN